MSVNAALETKKWFTCFANNPTKFILSFASTRFIYCHLYINIYINRVIYILTGI